MPDRLLAKAGEPIATLGPIPAGKNATALVALLEMQRGAVPRNMVLQRGMPANFAGNVTVRRTFPNPAEMQRMLATGSGSYIMAAFAEQDIYTHNFGVPIVVTLQKVPSQ